MVELNIAQIFCDRLSEVCLLKDISKESLIKEFSKQFNKDWLVDCFDGKVMPSDILLVGLSHRLSMSVDSFFEQGERITDKNMLIIVQRERKIKHLEKVLGKKIAYSAENYKQILQDSVKEALEKEIGRAHV